MAAAGFDWQSELAAAPLRPLPCGDGGSNLLYAKLWLAAASSDEQDADPDPASVRHALLLTDLLNVWCAALPWREALDALDSAEDNPSGRAMPFAGMLHKVHGVIYGDPASPDEVSIDTSDRSALRVKVWISKRWHVPFTCRVQEREAAAALLREQVTLPVLQICAFLLHRAPALADGGEGAVSDALVHAAEHDLLDFSGVVGDVYSALMRQRVARARAEGAAALGAAPAADAAPAAAPPAGADEGEAQGPQPPPARTAESAPEAEHQPCPAQPSERREASSSGDAAPAPNPFLRPGGGNPFRYSKPLKASKRSRTGGGGF